MATASIPEKTGSVSDIEETHYRHLPDIFNHTNTPIEPFIHFYPALNLFQRIQNVAFMSQKSFQSCRIGLYICLTNTKLLI